ADPAELVESTEWDADVSSRLASAVSRLDARSQDILKRRWMAEEKATLHELAAEHGVSAERIRQIEATALNKLKGLMAAA
ncbi:MAG: sigma factor-like helix-turn-helix DNA-binding protein, partial [Steroidobacteraceae bacterium]